VVRSHSHGELAVEVGSLQAVQFVEGAVCTRTGVHVHHAQLSASVGGVAADGRVFRQGTLTAGECQQAPAQFAACLPVTGHGALALAVGERIGHFLYALGVSPFDFVQGQHGVVAARCLDFQTALGHIPRCGEYAGVAPYG